MGGLVTAAQPPMTSGISPAAVSPPPELLLTHPNHHPQPTIQLDNTETVNVGHGEVLLPCGQKPTRSVVGRPRVSKPPKVTS
jgi:hypothetical protein